MSMELQQEIIRLRAALAERDTTQVNYNESVRLHQATLEALANAEKQLAVEKDEIELKDACIAGMRFEAEKLAAERARADRAEEILGCVQAALQIARNRAGPRRARSWKGRREMKCEICGHEHIYAEEAWEAVRVICLENMRADLAAANSHVAYLDDQWSSTLAERDRLAAENKKLRGAMEKARAYIASVNVDTPRGQDNDRDDVLDAIDYIAAPSQPDARAQDGKVAP